MCLQNEYDSGAVLYRQALAIRQRVYTVPCIYFFSFWLLLKVLGEEHPDVAVSLYHLATLMKYEKNYDAAYSMYSQSLAIVYKVCTIPFYALYVYNFHKVFGEEHIYVATLLDSVAMLLQAQKKYDEAEPLYHQSLAINRKVCIVSPPCFIHFFSTRYWVKNIHLSHWDFIV
jgi:tetratricopeptide (TPR) repeat protein